MKQYVDKPEGHGPDKPKTIYTDAKKSKAPDSSMEYHPEEIIGRCSECSILCTLEFPPGTFNWNDGDRIMEYYDVQNVTCLACKKLVRFKPIDMRNPSDRDFREMEVAFRSQRHLIHRLQK